MMFRPRVVAAKTHIQLRISYPGFLEPVGLATPPPFLPDVRDGNCCPMAISQGLKHAFGASLSTAHVRRMMVFVLRREGEHEEADRIEHESVWAGSQALRAVSTVISILQFEKNRPVVLFHKGYQILCAPDSACACARRKREAYRIVQASVGMRGWKPVILIEYVDCNHYRALGEENMSYWIIEDDYSS